MYTGLITDVGQVILLEEVAQSRRLTITAHYHPDRMQEHHTIACNGVAFPIIAKGGATGRALDDEEESWCTVEVSTQAFENTLVGQWKRGQMLNLELPLVHGAYMTGHIVNGRPDGMATLSHVLKVGDTHKLTYNVPKQLLPYLVPGGSVTVDGVALPVHEVNNQEAWIATYVVPILWEFTALHHAQAGNRFHIEVDALARYAAKLVKAGLAPKILQSIKES
ncbi:MAG: ribE [Rickettsiales bacterium]|nr:ribE [Rickettsiales bacterium]